MSLNYEQEWMRYYTRNPPKAQQHLHNVVARYHLPECWIHSSKTSFWHALVMEEVYHAQPSRRPNCETGSSNTIAITFTSTASSVSADTCGTVVHLGGAKSRKRHSFPLTVKCASTFRTRQHPGLLFIPMKPSTLRNEIRASPSPTSHSFTTL